MSTTEPTTPMTDEEARGRMEESLDRLEVGIARIALAMHRKGIITLDEDEVAAYEGVVACGVGGQR